MKVKVKKIPRANNGLQIEGNMYEKLSDDTIMIKGRSHDNGGTKVAYGGSVIEAEAGEPLSIDDSGNAIIWGNLTVPNTNKKFKSVAKEIANEEKKYNKQMDKGIELINSKDPYNTYELLSFNSGKVMADAAVQKDRFISEKKDILSQMQNVLLQEKESKKQAKNGYKMEMYKDGGNVQRIKEAVQRAALMYNINPDVLLKQVDTESSYNPSAVSPKNAKGIMQFIPSTAKMYGIEESELTSKDPAIQEKVIMAGAAYLKDLMGQYGGDETLALAAYNGGPGAVEFVKKLKEATAPAPTSEINSNPQVQVVTPQINIPSTQKKGIVPNTGLPYGDGKYATLEEFARKDKIGYRDWAKKNPIRG
jgi:hypothetical protein